MAKIRVSKFVDIVDMFCGGGGTSTGILNAAKECGLPIRLHAINHWDKAIATHSLNHANVVHVQDDLEKIDPSKVIPSGKLFLLTASPECTHFSNANGGKPLNKQSRATAKYILKWIRSLDVENLWLENVKEFQTWGPLYPCTCGTKDPKKHTKKTCHRPIPEKKGLYFNAFVRAIRKEGYQVKFKVLNTADYGDPQTRHRFFLIASKTHEPVFPQQTHSEVPDMFTKQWKPARDIIDWTKKGTSIYKRKRPLVGNTRRRIFEGFLRHGGGAFVLGQHSGSVPRSVNKPLMTICSEGALQLVQPFIYKMDQGGSVHSVDKPLPTITGAHAMTVVEPYLVNMEHTGANGSQTRSIEQPIPTVTSRSRIGLVEPYMVKYYGTAVSAPIDKPFPSITGKEHLALVEPLVIELGDGKYQVDFLYRMFTVDELAKGMSFPDGYKFVGTKDEQVKQIGNAVPVLTAKALTETFIRRLM